MCNIGFSIYHPSTGLKYYKCRWIYINKLSNNQHFLITLAPIFYKTHYRRSIILSAEY